MQHAIHRVTGFKVVGDYTLEVHFDDGVQQTINFKSMLGGELYGPLRDIELFDQVELDSEARTLVWPNGADFDPATLHDWPLYEQQLVERAARWEALADY